MSTVLQDGSGFSHALSTWREINLASLQKSLDASGLEIVENQKDSLMGRKKLAEQTRDFKKISDEEKVGAFKGLLKAYQAEIDALTKRSKTSESAFLNVYKLLAEAPDPYPLLDAAVDQTMRAAEAKLLEAELSRANEQIKSLKLQLGESEKIEKEFQKQTEKTERLESKLEEMVKLQVSNKEAELNAVYGERILNFQQREKDLTKQLELTKRQLADLRTSNESNQAKILDDSSRREHETVSRRAEIEMVEADLERSQRRVEEVERRNEKLRAEIESVRSGNEAQERVKALEAQITELQGETSRLLSTLEAQKQTITQTREERSVLESEYTRRIKKLEQEISTLRERVTQYSDYDEIKRELEIIKYVEFASLNPEEDEENGGYEDCSPSSSSINLAIKMPNPNADKANKQKTKSLENLLMTKNRKLQDDLTTLRVMHDELLTSSRKNTIETEKLKSELASMKVLNEKLENDLFKMQATANHSTSHLGPNGLATDSSQSSRQLTNDPNLGLKEDLGLSSHQRAGSSGQSPSMVAASSSDHKLSAETSILPIITSQRDRFRQRNAELEEELRKQFEAITATRSEMKSLQADNLKLYEKVRYLQSYRDEVGNSGYSSTRLNSSVPSAVSRKDEELSKYRGIYEEHMNPFEKFRGRERMGALQALNPLDKLVLHTANFILGSRFARNSFLLYALILHILLFFSFGESAWKSDGIGRSTSIPPPLPVQPET